jgi:hypothetical protein
VFKLGLPLCKLSQELDFFVLELRAILNMFMKYRYYFISLNFEKFSDLFREISPKSVAKFREIK